MNANPTIISAPRKLPTYTIPQLRNSCHGVMRRVAKLMTIRLLPVNSSAPATTTSISPSENPTPANSRVVPNPSPECVAMIVAKIPPSAMKAPASPADPRVAVNDAVTLSALSESSSLATSPGRWSSLVNDSVPAISYEQCHFAGCP